MLLTPFICQVVGRARVGASGLNWEVLKEEEENIGPIALFDKSFLQSLSLDESVWFDNFFITNVCPLFYVETLADLDKSVRQGRTPEEEVSVIADKFPEMHGSPNTHHAHLCVGDLFGDSVPMTGQIPLAGGHPVKSGGKKGFVYERSPEAEAFTRWRRHDFMEVERRYAQAWRRGLSELDLGEIAKRVGALGVDTTSCKTLEQAKAVAESVVSSTDRRLETMNLALLFLNVPPHIQLRILQRWSLIGSPPLADYAPYAAFVLMVEVFFQTAVSANLISRAQPSNRVDIAYLFYLPFCMVFVSSDRLHQRCAPLFLRGDQEFVWGQDLKEGLAQLDAYYSQLPASTKEKGVMSFAGDPPKEGEFLIAKIWDRHFPKWREWAEKDSSENPATEPALIQEINRMADAPTLPAAEVDFDPSVADALTIKRSVRKRKGSWYQVPKDLEAREEDRDE